MERETKLLLHCGVWAALHVFPVNPHYAEVFQMAEYQVSHPPTQPASHVSHVRSDNKTAVPRSLESTTRPTRTTRHSRDTTASPRS